MPACVLGHLIYVPFIANNRYGFTAMPFLVLSGAYGVSRLSRRDYWKYLLIIVAAFCFLFACSLDSYAYLGIFSQSKVVVEALDLIVKWTILLAMLLLLLEIVGGKSVLSRFKTAGGAVCILLIVLPLLSVAAYSTAAVSSREWKCPLRSGVKVCRKLLFSSVPDRTPQWACLLFDGNAAAAQASFEVNGHLLSGKPVGLEDYSDHNPKMLVLFATLMGRSSEELRQWRVVKIPLEYLRSNVFNQLCMKSSVPAGGIVYGSYMFAHDTTVSMPSTKYFAPELLSENISADESRPPAVVRTSGLADSQSWLERDGKECRGDLSPAPGKQFGQYRIFLLTGRSFKTDGSPDVLNSTNQIW